MYLNKNFVDPEKKMAHNFWAKFGNSGHSAPVKKRKEKNRQQNEESCRQAQNYLITLDKNEPL